MSGQAGPAERQVLDLPAILAAMQDQIDELMAAVEALEARLDSQDHNSTPTG